MMDFLNSRATFLDPGGIKYRCYPSPAEFRLTDNEASYLSALRSSNEDLVPTPLTLAVLLNDGSSADFAAQRYSVHKLIPRFGELLDPDRALHQLKIIISGTTDLRRQNVVELMKAINDAFVLGLRGWRRSELVLQFADDWDNSFIEQFINSGFDRIWLRLTASQALAMSPRQTVANLRSSGFQRTAIEIIDEQVRPEPRLMSELRAARPEHLSFWNAKAGDHDFVAPENRQSLLTDGYQPIGLGEFVHANDELALGPVYYTSFGFSTIEEGDRIAIGPGGISKIEDQYFQLATDTDRFQTIAKQGGLPVAAEFKSSLDDCIRRQVIHQLLTEGKLNLNRIQHRLDLDLTCYLRSELTDLAALIGAPAVDNSGSLLVPPELGHQLNQICRLFDRYTAPKCLEV